MPGRRKLDGLGIKPEQVCGHYRSGAAVGELVNELALAVERAQMDDAGAGAQHAEERDRVPRRVRQQQRNGAVAADPDLSECRRCPRGVVAEIAIADAVVLVLQRRPIAVVGDDAVEQVRQGRGRDRRIPAHPRRIGLFPRIRPAHRHQELALRWTVDHYRIMGRRSA
jgi:hypothetical protein